jgi:hypothetical protein
MLAITSVSASLGPTLPGSVLWIPAEGMDVYLAPMVEAAWMVAVYETPASAQAAGEERGRELSRIQSAAAKLAEHLSPGRAQEATQSPKKDSASLARQQPAAPDQTSPAAQSTPQTEPPPQAADPELENLLANRGGRKRIKTKELNDFWDNSVEESNGGSDGSKAISYEEARRRGLAPGDE